MNFKSSINIIFSLVVFASFADQDLTQKDIVYSPKGIRTITKMVFRKGVNDKNTSEQICFAEGLTRFCKEKGIKEGDVIGKKAIKKFLENPLISNHLILSNSHFPVLAFVRHIDRFVTSDQIDKWSCFVKHSIYMTPAMKKFVQEMIEKGKSVNQN